MIQKEVRQRIRKDGCNGCNGCSGWREEGRGKREEGSRKRGTASRYLFPGIAWEQGKGTRDAVRAPCGLCLIRSDFNRLGNEAILLIFPTVWHCGAGHTCSIDTSAIYISIAEVGIGKIGIPQIGKSQVCTV